MSDHAAVTTHAEVSADNFLASLDGEVKGREAEITWNAYVIGWIQGCYAGANEHKSAPCRRPARPSRWQTATHRRNT